MKRVDLVFFDAGGGHRSAASALRMVIQQQGRPWEVRLVNLQEVLEPLDMFKKITGIRGEDVYNLFLRKGWTLGSPQLLVLMHGLIRMYHGKQVKLLRDFWRVQRPDLVVSVIPNFDRSIFESLKAEQPGTPMVTILTDMADYPPHFWIEQQEQYFVCGTEKAARQALELGHPEERVFRTSGMILNPKFYEPVTSDRSAIGLDPNLPTAVVLFGGHGSGVMLEIAEKLQGAGLAMQMIMICGHNERLAAKVRAVKGPVKMHVEGFTKEVPSLMKMADFLIGKPGPGSISEALAMKLPVIVEQNAWTLPQERYNADWVREQGVGVVLRSFRDIASGVKELLEPAKYAKLRAAVAVQNNRAVFEIPDILEKLLTIQ
jgi:UDP-N-acetylglucosamine:LPS N-acetylglucosamine transferase